MKPDMYNSCQFAHGVRAWRKGRRGNESSRKKKESEIKWKNRTEEKKGKLLT